MTKWGPAGRSGPGGCRAEVVGGIAIDVLTRCDSAWILAPYRGTGHAFDRENDELRGRHDEMAGQRLRSACRPRAPTRGAPTETLVFVGTPVRKCEA